MNQWARAALSSTNVVSPVASTHPTGNWDSWQTALRATISGSGAPAWFTGGSQTGFTGDAPPEVITWVINHLPTVVVRDSVGMGLVVVLAGAEV
jgi:hypothetical protein